VQGKSKVSKPQKFNFLVRADTNRAATPSLGDSKKHSHHQKKYTMGSFTHQHTITWLGVDSRRKRSDSSGIEYYTGIRKRDIRLVWYLTKKFNI